MNSDFDLVNLPFDRFTRNLLTQKLINSIRKTANDLKILDVGGRAGDLRNFLPDDEIHVLDIRSGEESNYVVGNIAHAPYKDASFDVVVSSEVYEHIPPENRLNAVRQMLRISKNYVILGAPFESKEVADAEIKACNYYREILGGPHPWLKEHIESGLPSQKKLEEFLRSMDVEFLTIQSNNVSIWLLFQLFDFYAFKYGIPDENKSKVFQYYNKNYMDLGDSFEPSYRKIYLFGKKGTLPKVDFRSSKMDLVKYNTVQALIFQAIRKLADSKDTQVNNLELVINENKQNFESIINENKQNFESIINENKQNFESIINQNKQNLESIINENKQNFESIINENNKQIVALEKEIQNKDDHIIQLNNLVAENSKVLNDIKNSITWRLATKYQHTADRLLPISTKRRSMYDLGIIGLRTFLDGGSRALFYKIRERYGKKYINTSKMPIVETRVVSPLAPLSLAEALSGQFVFTANRLSEIRIFTATYKRRNSDLEFQIMDSNGHILRERKIEGYSILDNDYTSFKFKPIEDSKGRIFFFRVKAKGEPDAAVWYNEARIFPGLNLYYNNEPLNGSIGFQAFADLGMQNPYDLWIIKNEPTKTKLEEYEKEIHDFSYQPKISILTPVFNPDIAWIKAAIESVINQVYPNWELCLADASTKEDVKKCLKTYSEMDSRIKVRFLSENKGISGNSNEALSLATGKYIGLLDHDDELSPDALFEVVKILQTNPGADMIYSDEDKIDIEGNRQDPFFKPDWSPDLLLTVNYICHFTVIRTKLVEEVGQFNIGFEGSQDYDLFLRVIEKTSNIEHVPRILYHWRMTPGSTASNINAKENARINGAKALQNHLIRQKIDGNVSNNFNGTNRIEYMIEDYPLVSIIIPFKDKVDYLKKCINSITKYTKEIRYEILLISNNSQEKETFEYLNSIKENSDINIITYDYPFNFAAINNFAAKKSSGSYLLFLNNDTEVITDNWLHYLLMNAQRKEIGCVGAKLLYPNGTIQHAGVVLGLTGMAGHVFAGLPENQWTNFGLDSWSRNYLAVTAACLMISKEKFDQVGGFDENFTICGNDIDLCLRVYRQGYRNLYIPYVRLYHFESISRGKEIPVGDFQASLQSYKYFLENGDPFYNPNLTLENTSCSLNKYSERNFEVNIDQIRTDLLKIGCKVESK